MPRRVRTIAYEGNEPASLGRGTDGYFDKIIKYIPSDVVGAWIAATGVIKSSNSAGHGSSRALWIAFAVGVVATALWTWKQTTEPNAPPAIKQIAMSTLAFVVWVVALGGPFATIDGYQDYIGSLLLIGYLLFAGLV
ncbi:MAG: hypothetical protein NVSMB18_17430 [Acetobacteraceae bacterium]